MKNKEHEQLAGLVEHIVREVLVRVAAAETSPARFKQSSHRVMSFAGCVISLADLKQLCDKTNEIQVAPTAVITPAARDELRKRGVRIVRGEAGCVRGAKNATAALVVGVVDGAESIHHAIGGLGRSRTDIEQLPRLSLVEQVDALVEQVVRGGRRGVLVTSNVAAALCLANRHRGVRAVAGGTSQNVRRDVEQLAANLLVVDSAGRSTFEVLQLMREFASSVAGTLSPDLRDQLE